MAADNSKERFRATHGRVSGWVLLALCVAFVVWSLADREAGMPAWVLALAVLVGALAWASMLRPGVSLGAETLELRSMLETATIPLAAVENVTVRQVLVVRAGERRYVCPAIGRSRRQLHGDNRRGGSAAFGLGAGAPQAPPAGDAAGTSANSYGLLVEQRLRRAAEDARARAGVAERSPEQRALAERVVRAPAWPEIVVVVGAAAATVLLALL